MTVQLRVSRTLFPVTVLGPGARAGIWVQGCSIRCGGCMARDTWSGKGGFVTSSDELVAWVAGLPATLKGVTISGGEPTEQPEGLARLFIGLRSVLPDDSDILVFTGHSPEWARGEGAELLSGADAVMAGPFVSSAQGELPLRGSDNQELLLLTDLGRSRYGDESALGPRGQLQVGEDAHGLFVVGIPVKGVLPDTDTGGLLQLRRTSW